MSEMMKSGVHFTSKSDDWATPQYLVDWAADRFIRKGCFDLDPCASHLNYKAKSYFNIDDDGLSKMWFGNVWLNPPYGRSIRHWIDKALASINEGGGRCETVTLLIPARTDTIYFHRLIELGAEIIFIKGRIQFGNSKASAPFPSCFVHLSRSRIGSGFISTSYEVVA